MRRGCHLCAAAREVVDAVASEAGTGVVETDVDDSPELRDRYGEMVPVVLVDGVQQGFYVLDADRLRRALAARRP